MKKAKQLKVQRRRSCSGVGAVWQNCSETNVFLVTKENPLIGLKL